MALGSRQQAAATAIFSLGFFDNRLPSNALSFGLLALQICLVMT